MTNTNAEPEHSEELKKQIHSSELSLKSKQTNIENSKVKPKGIKKQNRVRVPNSFDNINNNKNVPFISEEDRNYLQTCTKEIQQLQAQIKEVVGQLKEDDQAKQLLFEEDLKAKGALRKIKKNTEKN